MHRTPSLAASVLAADPLRLAEEVASLAEGTESLHVDVMDFHFAANSFGTLPMVKGLREVTDALIECHLYLNDPLTWAPRFVEAGAERIVFQAEISEKIDLDELATAIRTAGAEPVLGLLYFTELEQYLDQLKKFDTILVVAVPETGFGSQSTGELVFDKMARLRDFLADNDLPVRISVDGGIGAHNIARARQSGADNFIVGSDLFRQEDRPARLKMLRELIAEADLEHRS